jgi:hypothetical protein
MYKLLIFERMNMINYTLLFIIILSFILPYHISKPLHTLSPQKPLILYSISNNLFMDW